MVPDRDATVSRTPEAARAPAPRSAGANPVLQGRRSQVGVPQGHVVDPPALRPFSPEVPQRAQSVSDAAIGDLASPESTGAIRSIRSILSGGPSTMRATDHRMGAGLSLLSRPIASHSSLSAAAPSTREKESVSAVPDQAEVHGISLQILAKENGCVLGSGSRVRLSKAIHQGGVYCKQRGVDQKEFWSFAHDPE